MCKNTKHCNVSIVSVYIFVSLNFTKVLMLKNLVTAFFGIHLGTSHSLFLRRIWLKGFIHWRITSIVFIWFCIFLSTYLLSTFPILCCLLFPVKFWFVARFFVIFLLLHSHDQTPSDCVTPIIIAPRL